MKTITIPANDLRPGDEFVDPTEGPVWRATCDAFEVEPGSALSGSDETEIGVGVQYVLDGGHSTRVWQDGATITIRRP
jgi:hypothetical protein